MQSQADLNPEAIKQLQSLDAGGNGVFALLVKAYLNDAAKIMQSLESSYRAGDFTSLCKLIHTFKGSSGNFGARQVVSLCVEIEGLASVQDSDAIPAKLERLRAEYELVEKALRELVPA